MSQPALAAPRADRTLLYLFLGLRLSLLIVYQPALVNVPGGVPFDRGITVYGDFLYHFGIADNARSGLLPYRDFWYEYPPIIPVVSGAVYTLSRANFPAYANLLALVMIALDAGSLFLVRQIGRRLRGDSAGDAAAWAYALMPAPLIVGFWNFEALVVFTTLAALALLMGRRGSLAAVLIAVGGLVKLIPLVILAAVWRCWPAIDSLRITGIALGLTAGGLLAVLIFGPAYGGVSLTAQFNKASHQTVWALIDGNYGTGTFSEARLDLAAASLPRGNPPVVPGLVRTALFAGIGALMFFLTRRRDAEGVIGLAALAITLAYLWSPGWSTQWQALIVPFMLLMLPGRPGVLMALALTAVSFVEYPVLFARGMGAEGALAAAYMPLFALLVIARTAILAGFGAMLFARLRSVPLHLEGATP